MKTSLEKEINTYRELLEGTTNREGLKQIVDHVVEEARRWKLNELLVVQVCLDQFRIQVVVVVVQPQFHVHSLAAVDQHQQLVESVV